jgi:pimeloyl-ACP methyl ester carboxylesterase
LSFLARQDPRAWVSLAPDLELPDHLVLLVHGLDEPGTIWNDLAPALASRGYTVARLDYPNDQAIANSADYLADTLRGLHSRGTQRVDLICHSMGGLVARDALTRADHYAGQARGHADLPDIDHLVMIATPHTGSPLAPLHAIADGREQVVRWADSPDHDWRLLLAFVNDGRGQAADDLTPGSRFLTDLNARPALQGVAITSIAAELVIEKADTAQAAALPIHVVADRLGDGVVPFHSAAAYTAGEVVQVRATHRGVLRLTETERRLRAGVGAAPRTAAAIPIILDRLSQPFSLPATPPS